MAKNISRQVNLLERYNSKKKLRKKENNKKQSMAIYMVLISLVLAAGLGCAYYYIETERDKTDSELTRLQDSLTDSELRDLQVEATRYAALNATLNKKLVALETVKKNIGRTFSDYTFLVTDLYKQLDTLCGNDIKITYYQLDGNLLSLGVEPKRADLIADFVIRVEESGLFTVVGYNGFASGTDEEDNEFYTFAIECVF